MTVLTVNGVQPDGNGNIQLTAQDIGGSYVQTVNNIHPNAQTGDVALNLANIPFAVSHVTFDPNSVAYLGMPQAFLSSNYAYIEFPSGTVPGGGSMDQGAGGVCQVWLPTISASMTYCKFTIRQANPTGQQYVIIGAQGGQIEPSSVSTSIDLITQNQLGQGYCWEFVADVSTNSWYLISAGLAGWNNQVGVVTGYNPS